MSDRQGPPADDGIESVVREIDDWLLAHAPVLHATMTPGASEAELAGVEAAVGRRLPAAFHALYRRHEHWQWAFGALHLSVNSDHYSLDVAAVMMTNSTQAPHFDYREAGMSSVPDDAVNTEFIDVGRLPLITDGGGNYVGLDFLPGPAGVEGQVLAWGRDDHAWTVLADSLDGFLREVATRLRQGRVTVVHPEGDPHEQQVLLTDDAGVAAVAGHRQMVDFFPGFGAAPTRLPAILGRS
ncbi:MAG: SMI1/KNR4 family protein [Kineosporiaceae bacterium]|nr:SMI1/KNR4 family protein [Kineosporiaceae bacterium]